METWQKEHIKQNLTALVEMTDCNTFLMTELNSCFSKSDEEQLSAMRKSEGRSAEARLFYEKAVTKSEVYEALTYALRNTQQSGAYKILLQGATIHQPNEALPGIGKYALTRIVNFQGQEIRLQELLEQFPEDVIERLTGFMGDMHDKLIDNKQPILINNSVPPDIPYYIHRRLTSRCGIEPTVFLKRNCTDIFIIQHIQLHELSQLVGSQGVDLSTNQIESLTLRFIVLVFEKDYEQITRMTSDPVHLLDYKENRFTWLKSHGSLSVLQKYIAIHQQVELTEDKFLESCLKSDYPVCISDTPGMGKTVLLASLARSIMQRYPKRIVCYIVLGELVPLVQVHATPEIDEEYLMQTIFESASEYALGRELIKELLKFDHPVVELMFDGFDEVLSSQVSTAKNILRNAANMKSVRIYVTTRPHMRDELERTLGVLGYNIQPFGLDEQIDCLIKYWKQEENKKEKGGMHLILKMSVLEEFAKECLAALESNMNDSERGIAGIPLQCKMLAEVYQEDAIKQATPDGKVSNFDVGIVIRITSIFDMYQKLIEMRFQKISKPDKAGEYDKAKLKSLTFAHMSAAVQLLFPESVAKLNVIFTEKTKVDPLELCGLGILEKKHPTIVTPRFIHRTFAEYFIGLFVVRMLRYHDDFGLQYFVRRSFLNFLYNIVLVTDEKCEYFLDYCKFGNSSSISAPWFSYSVICYFINAHLKHFKTPDVGKSPWTNDASKLFNVLAASIVHDYPAVFQQLSEEPTAYPTLVMKTEQVPYLTMLSAKRSSIELFKMTHNYLILYLQTEKPNFIISSDPEFEITPLHIAMERGHFAITDFILNILAKNPASREPMYAVHCCVRESLHDKISTIESKVQIIRLVFSKFPSWINESMSDGTTPLLQSRVHSTLLETLLECKADVNNVSNSGCVLHRLVENEITPKFYHDMFLLFYKHGFRNFNCVDIGKRTPLHVALQNVELLENTLILFKLFEADIHAVDEQGESVFFFAVRSKRSEALLNQLISSRCNWKKENNNHDNVFHVAAKHGNHEAFEYFLEHQEFEISMLSTVNKMGFIPFMQALSQGKGLTMRLIKTMEEKGFEVTKKVASEGLKAFFCNKYIMAWELDNNFISVTNYLIRKGGIIECRNGVNPWYLEATQKNLDKIAVAIKFTEEFRKDLQKREVCGFETQESLPNEMELLNEDLIADLKAINYPLIAARETPREDTLKSIPENLINQENSFERFCVSLVACKQIQPFTLLKQCLQSDLQESVKFVTQMTGINSFIHSQQYQVAVLRSHSIDLSITRLRNTIDPDMPIIQNEDLSGEFHEANILLYRCKSADNDVIQTLNNLENKSICVCSEIIGELDNSLIIYDDIAWEDLSTDFQDKLNLWTGVRSELRKTSFAAPLNLKNEQLVAFILEQEQSSTELHRMIDEFAKGYSRHEHLSWIPEQIHGEITPLHIAAKLGYVATTKFLLSSKSQSDLQRLKYLIHFCVAESAGDDSDTILRKETIIRLLIKKNISWIDESFYQTETPPFLQSKVNEKLLECLVKCGADIKIVVEHRKGLTVRLVEILEENCLPLTIDLASKTLTNLFCTKRIMGWELNSDFVKVAEFLLGNGAKIICRNGESAWELEAVKANMKRIAEATLFNHDLMEQLEKRGFHDIVRFTDSDLVYNILQTLGHKKSFEYLCTSLIACNQVKPYILLKLCLQSDGNQAAKFITPPIGIAEFLENKACNVAVLQSCNMELSIARIKETVDTDAAVLTEADIHRESNQFKEHYTNMLVLECGTATDQTIRSLTSIHCKIFCVCTEISKDVRESEACKILFDEISWEDLSADYKEVLNCSKVARHNTIGNLYADCKLLRDEGLVKFILGNPNINIMENIQHYKNEYLKTIPTFFSAMIPKFSPTPLHIAVERGHAAITEYLLAPSLYSASEDLKYLVHCCVAGSISDSDPVITNKMKIIELISQKHFQLLDERLTDGRTPLLQSSVHSKLVECLINQGADTNVQIKNGVTFLIKILSSGHGLNPDIFKLMEEKGHIISQQEAFEGLSALFSSKNTKPFGLNQDFIQILDYLTEKFGNLAAQNSIWESELIRNSLPKIEKVTQRNKKLLEELQRRGILTELKMEEDSNQPELLFKSLKMSEHHNSFAVICSSLVACNQIEPFMLLKQCFRSDITDRIMFLSPQEELSDFVQESKHDCVAVLRSWDFELTIERIKDTIDADLFHVNDETLYDELPITSILIYKCEKATDVDVKRLAAFQRKIICLCKSFDAEIKDVKLYEDKITWNHLSEELKYDLMSCICDADVETIGKYSDLNDDELVNFIRQNLPQFTSIEKKESNNDDVYLSKDIFQFFHVDKFVFIGISRDELNTYIKFDHKICGTGDDIDKLDFMLIENEQGFEEICKETNYNVHLIEHQDGRFKLLKTRSTDNKLKNFIEKNPKKPKCDNIPVCTCGEHRIGSGNLIWNVFHVSRKERRYWINILDIIEQMEIRGFKLGDSLTLSEVTKLFNSKFSGLSSFECWKKIRKQIGGTFLRNNSIQTANVIKKLLKYISCDEGERKQLIYIAVKMLFPKSVRTEDVVDLEKYFECGVLKYVDSSPVFAQNNLTWYFISELFTSDEDIAFVNMAELKQDILRDCIESTKSAIRFYRYTLGFRQVNFYIKSFESFRFVNTAFFNYLESISSLHYEVISSVLREFPDKTEDFWKKWLHACVLGNHFNLLKLGISSSISMKQTESELQDLRCLAVKLADIPVIDLLIELFPLQSKHNVFGFEVITSETEVVISILHIAALRGSYSVFYHLITNKGFNETLSNKNMRNIIAYCVYDSANNPSQIEERKLIIRLVLEHDSTLINDESANEVWISPLLVPYIHVDLVKFLINLGVDCNVIYKNYKNTLHFHAEYMTPENYHKLAETLFTRRDSKIFNAVDGFKNTPLHDAVCYVELLDKTMELFSAAKADFNAKDKYGDTVLFKAVDCNRSLRVLKTLIHYGADFTIRGKDGHSVLHKAAQRGNVSALRYFITLGCEINAKSEDDNTPLHAALRWNPSDRHETVNILIEHGADVNAVNNDGKTPISLAESRYVGPRTVAILKNAASREPK